MADRNLSAAQPSSAATVEPVLSGLQEDLILMSFHNEPAATVDNQSLAQAMYAEGYADAKAEQTPAATVEIVAVEGDLDAIVQLIHKHVGIRQRINVDLTGVEDAGKAILATLHPHSSAGNGDDELEAEITRLKLLAIAKDNEIHRLRTEPQSAVANDEVLKLRAAIDYACDLLAERTYGSSARSPGHNARLHLETALALSRPKPSTDR